MERDSLRLFYWRGQGTVGSIVRHASSSQWGHIGVGISLGGAAHYFDSFPGKGFRLVPVELDNLPQGIQQTGLVWLPGMAEQAFDMLFGRRYSYINGILAAFGHRRNSRNIQCAQAAEVILRLAGLDMHPHLIPEPQGIANEVERLTGHPVRRVFNWGGHPIRYRGMPEFCKNNL